MSAPVLQFRPGGEGVHVDLTALVASRLLIQGSSGAGKSWLIRYLLEQTHRQIQQFVFDPEGEFVTLREKHDYVVASAGADGDVRAHPDTAALLCRQLVELQASAIFDIYDLSPEDREQFVANFLNQLLHLPKEQWRSAIVAIDEAHEYAPQAGQPPSRKPLELLVSKGRKRGLCSILATQRVSKLSKNASEVQSFLVGLTGLDTDVKRAGDLLGFDRAQREQLKHLEPGKGEFFAFGPAFGPEVVRVRSGDVLTHHPKPGEIRAPTPPASGELARLIAQMAAVPAAAPEDEEDDDQVGVDELRARVRGLRAQVRAGAPAAAARTGPSEAEITKRVRWAREEGWRAAAETFRGDLGPHAAALYHALANGGTPVLPADEAAPAPAAAVVTAARDGYQAVSPRRPRAARRASPSAEGDSALTGPHRRILASLAWWDSIGIGTPGDAAVAFVAQYTPSNSSYQKALGQLRTAGLVDYPVPGARCRTATGREASPEVVDRPRSKASLHATVLEQLDGPQRRILEPLLRAYPKELPIGELAAAAGYEESNSSFQKARSKLKTLELITYPGQRRNVAADFLFPKGLR